MSLVHLLFNSLSISLYNSMIAQERRRRNFSFSKKKVFFCFHFLIQTRLNSQRNDMKGTKGGFLREIDKNIYSIFFFYSFHFVITLYCLCFISIRKGSRSIVMREEKKVNNGHQRWKEDLINEKVLLLLLLNVFRWINSKVFHLSMLSRSLHFSRDFLGDY